MIEVNWGSPLRMISPQGDTETFHTIEQVEYWLERKWPVSDDARDVALRHVQAAMDCIAPVGAARLAFLDAARSAGYQPLARAH